jgi:CRISPR-associated protein Cas2
MKVLVTYDVATTDKAGIQRLRRVARACEDYGQRVQKSVFECVLSPLEWIQLQRRLLDEIDAREDSLRFYMLAADIQVEHHGIGVPADLEGLLLV